MLKNLDSNIRTNKKICITVCEILTGSKSHCKLLLLPLTKISKQTKFEFEVCLLFLQGGVGAVKYSHSY